MEKAVLVTGSSSGIGREIAMFFARQGETVIAASRRAEEAGKVDTLPNIESGRIIPLKMDISDEENMFAALNRVREEYSITGLVNNAGISSFKNALDNSSTEIKNIIATNLTGTILLTREILKDMINLKTGRIINILSVTTKKIFIRSSIYAASKSGLESYMNVLREELREYNIRVTNVYPGATKTPIWPNEALEKYASRMMKPDGIAKIIYDAYMLNDNIVPEEIVLRPMKGDL